MPEVISFKILTTFDSLSHLSAEATLTITCGNTYTISEVLAPTSPQFVSHGVFTAGFALPDYTHEAITGCPLSVWEVTSDAGSMVSHPDLNSIVPEVSGVKTVIPSDMNAHTVDPFVFYAQVTAEGGSVGRLGPYSLYVGCSVSTVTITDHASSQGDKMIHVGDSVEDQFVIYYPTTSRAWCVNELNEMVNADGTTWDPNDKFSIQSRAVD
jgi:hypothetical protein